MFAGVCGQTQNSDEQQINLKKKTKIEKKTCIRILTPSVSAPVAVRSHDF